jgi:hypothetical protein
MAGPAKWHGERAYGNRIFLWPPGPRNSSHHNTRSSVHRRVDFPGKLHCAASPLFPTFPLLLSCPSCLRTLRGPVISWRVAARPPLSVPTPFPALPVLARYWLAGTIARLALIAARERPHIRHRPCAPAGTQPPSRPVCFAPRLRPTAVEPHFALGRTCVGLLLRAPMRPNPWLPPLVGRPLEIARDFRFMQAYCADTHPAPLPQSHGPSATWPPPPFRSRRSTLLALYLPLCAPPPL